MHNNYEFLCVCVCTNWSKHLELWMCPGFICIWRWVHSGGWILRDLFSNQHQEMPGRVHSASHNPLIPKRHLPRATGHFVSSPLASFHPFCSYLGISFNSFSPRCFFQPGWHQSCFELHIFCLFWMVFDQVTAGFQCFCTFLFCFFFTIFQTSAHLGPI